MRLLHPVEALILTGAGEYYCAGVNLGSTSNWDTQKPSTWIVEHNQALFDTFIDFPKPILVAVNGPAIGAAVTSATLCDGIIAPEKATRRPCETRHLSRRLLQRSLCSAHGEETAQRMLGVEGWTPTARSLGSCFVQWTVRPMNCLSVPNRSARAGFRKAERSYRAGATREN